MVSWPWYIQGMPPKRVSICGSEGCPGRRACRACRRIVEAKRRADGKVQPRRDTSKAPPHIAALAVGVVSAEVLKLDHLTPGPELKPREPGPGDNRGWCKRCGELTDQMYQRTLDQAKVRLCKRCQRESEAELVI